MNMMMPSSSGMADRTDEESALLQQSSLHTNQLGGVTEAVSVSSSAQNRSASEQDTYGSKGQRHAPLSSNASPAETGPNGWPRPQSSSAEQPIDEKGVLRKVDRHLLPLLFSLALLCSIDRANLSYAALQLNYDLQFSQTVYGLGSGLFFIGYMVFQIPATYVCSRVGAPRFLGSILVVWGLVATLFAWMQTSAQFYTLRFILGLAESGAYPGMWYLLALFYDDKELGVAYTAVATAVAIAGVLGGPIAAGLLCLNGVGGLRGWQWLFLLEGLPAVALGVAIWCALAHSPSRARFLSPEEQQWLVERRLKQPRYQAENGEEEQMENKVMPPPTGDALEAKPFYHIWCIWYLGLVWTLVATGLDGIVFWGPILIHSILDLDSSSGMDTWATVQAALLSAIPFGSASICMLVNAQLSKKAGERHWHGTVPVFIAAVALALMPVFMGRLMWGAFICLTFAAGGIWANHGPLLSWPAAFLQGTNAAAGFALMKMMGSVGSFCGPFLIGALADANGGSFVPAMLVLSGVLFLASGMHLLIREPGTDLKIFPRFPYSCGRVMKRSRSDMGTLTLGPTLRGIFGTRCRELTFQRWKIEEDAAEGRTLGQQQPGAQLQAQHSAAHLSGEDGFLWEKHTQLPRF